MSRTRPGMAAALVGPAGIGKSHAAARLLRGLPYRCHALVGNRELAAQLADLPGADRFPSWLVNVFARAEDRSSLSPEALLDAALAALGRLAPVALLVEDVHDATPERRQLLLRLAAAISGVKGAALILTSREPLSGDIRQLRLEPLALTEMTRLLEADAGAPLPAEAVEWIGDRAGGNPLFALEHFRHLARQGFVWSDGRRWRWRQPDQAQLPGSIEALVSHSLRNACRDEESRLVAGASAYLGHVVGGHELPLATGLPVDTVTRGLHSLRSAGILHDGDFVHPLYREVAQRLLPPGWRESLARSMMVRLAEDPVRAAHFVGDANLEETAARQLLERAAERARGEGNRPLAARLLREAAQRDSGEPRTTRLLQAATLYRTCDTDAALELTGKVLEQDPGHSEALLLHAELLVLQGRQSEAERFMAAAADVPGLGRRWQRLELRLHAERGSYAEAVRLWRDRPELAAEDSKALRSVSFALQQLGCYEEAEALLDEALSRADGLAGCERAELLHGRAAASYYRGSLQEAAELWRDVSLLLEGGDETVLRGRALGNRAAALRRLCRFDEAIESAEAAIAIFDELGLGRDYARQRHNLANLLRASARFEQAEEMLLDCRDTFERLGDASYLVACDIDLTYLYLAWDPPYASALALRAAHAALEAAHSSKLPGMIEQAERVVIRAEAAFGDSGLALRLAEERVAAVDNDARPHEYVLDLSARAWARSARGDRDGAAADFRECVRLEEDSGNTLQALDYALEVDRLAEDREGARIRHRVFLEHGLLGMAYLTRRYFPELDGEKQITAELRLEVLGPFRLKLNGVELAYRAGKGRELLARLLEARLAGRGELTQLELQEELYPDADDSSAASSLQQLVYRLRTALGSEAVLRTQDGYALGAVTSDVEEFLAGGRSELWRGSYLCGMGGGWSHEVRERLETSLRGCAERAGGIASSGNEKPHEALRLAAVLLEAEPFDRDLLVWATNLALSLGARKWAEAAFAAARIRFAEVGEVLPTRLEELEREAAA